MNSQLKKSIAGVVGLLTICGILVVLLSFWLGGGDNTATLLNEGAAEALALEEPLQAEELAAYEGDITNRMNPIAVFQTNHGVIEIELFDDAMPITAGNFMKLAREGFYDGTKFHRVIEGFMVQGGDPNSKTDNTLSYGTGGPGYSIPDEHIAGDKLSNVRGSISMANSGPESGGSQFFINLTDNTNLDYDKAPFSSKHPVFGQVVVGMDVIDAIGQIETGPTDLPLDAVVVESVTIKEG